MQAMLRLLCHPHEPINILFLKSLNSDRNSNRLETNFSMNSISDNWSEFLINARKSSLLDSNDVTFTKLAPQNPLHVDGHF